MNTSWKRLKPGRYHREINGFTLECNRHEGKWYWSCWREVDFYQSGISRTRRIGKANATRNMNYYLKTTLML